MLTQPHAKRVLYAIVGLGKKVGVLWLLVEVCRQIPLKIVALQSLRKA